MPTHTRAHGCANTPHADKSKTGLILVSRISYFHASIKNCGGAPTVSTQMNPACLMPSTLVCAPSANQVVLTRMLKSCWKLRTRRNLAEQFSHVNACCEPQQLEWKRRHLCCGADLRSCVKPIKNDLRRKNTSNQALC